MNVINRSPYNTRHLRSTVLAAARSLDGPLGPKRQPWWKHLKIYVVLSGAKVSKLNWGPRFGQIHVRVPKLTGDEWHQIARDTTDGRALTTAAFANLIRAELSIGTTQSWRVEEPFLRKLPKIVPLRVTRPPAPARDPVRDRLERAQAQEKNWIRKQKLAGTKVKFYRKRKLYYEKRLAARKEVV